MLNGYIVDFRYFRVMKENAFYSSFGLKDFYSRYFSHADLEKYLAQYFTYKQKIIGYSFSGLPIYKLTVGLGEKKILVWTQMHGNESTGTRAMLDVIEYLKQNNTFILNTLQIDIVLMLNPDGSNIYNRANTMGIDINRDFNQKITPEIEILRQTVEKGNYKMLFNLHDQRSIFSAGKTNKSAILSFLAPSYDKERSMSKERQNAIKVIVIMNKKLQELIPNHIGRYSDEFYPEATGDNFMKLGFANILIEAGHHPEDIDRNETRKYMAISVIEGLEYLANLTESTADISNDLENYLQIPENEENFYDVIIRNVKMLSQNGRESVCDVALHYKDEYQIEDKKLLRRAYVEQVGVLATKFGHIELDGSKEVVKHNSLIVKGELANLIFKVIQFTNGIQA